MPTRKPRAPTITLMIITREALEWATLNNARALELGKKISFFISGKKSHIIFINTNELHLFDDFTSAEFFVF